MSLDKIESLRFEDPVASVNLAEELLKSERDLAPSLSILCELGSSLRACGRLSDSSECLLETIAAAGRRRWRSILSDALWRLATTRIDQGRIHSALRLSSESALNGAMAGVRRPIGLAFWVRGVANFELGRLEDCQEDFEAAEPYLTKPIDLASLAINKYYNSRQRGFATEPPNLDVQILPTPLKIGLLWIEAREATSERALEAFSEIFKLTLKRQDWVNSALSGVEIVCILAAEGRHAEAAEAVGDLRPLLFKLEKNPLARGAVGRLVKAALLNEVALASAARYCLTELRQSQRSLSRRAESCLQPLPLSR